MNSFDILFENIKEPEWVIKIRPFIDKLLLRLKIDYWEFSITFCNDSFIRQLNKDYRSKDTATDVLTFAQDDNPVPFADLDELHNAGDIIISLDTLGENAEYFGVEEQEELKRLLIHGILHLMGMNHSNNSPEQEMLIYQEKLMVDLVKVKIF